jgi:hypothetical protein
MKKNDIGLKRQRCMSASYKNAKILYSLPGRERGNGREREGIIGEGD